MFYLFHHMPKCGGTSFLKFLSSVFNVHADYHKGNAKSHPKEFQEYINNPVQIEKLTINDCLAGHYNIAGIKIWQRYPLLERYHHKKFSILREPYEAAISGIRFGIKRKWYDKDMSKEVKERLLLSRSRYFSITLGVKDENHAKEVMDKYWFIAPLNKIDLAAKIVAYELGKEPITVQKLNTTQVYDGFFDKELLEKFQAASTLDTFIYNLCVSRFEHLCENLKRG